ncbi:MAG: FUSC family protein [Mycolicibacterium sp.]|uniref:FUSC family protein n=1 Tax=Mycolicibacterium sp. TaxID=2320850 RepID=UPI003D0C76BF
MFGSIALLVVVDFPGNRNTRALSYLWLGCIGVALITLGTFAATNVWLAVSLMFVIGLTVSFAGLLSESIAAGQRSTLLTFVLPVCIPVGPLDHRLMGWLIAFAISVPAALFVWPPRHHDELRQHASDVCRKLAGRIKGSNSGPEVATAMEALRANFLGAAYRPAALTAGSRALVRVVDDLQWLCDRVDADTGDLLGRMADPASEVLEDCAHILTASRPGPRDEAHIALAASSARLHAIAVDDYKSDIVVVLAEPDDSTAVELGRRLLNRRTIGAAIGLIGRIVLGAATADARPAWARVLGRQLPEAGVADRMYSGATAATFMTTGYVKTHAITVRDSLRTGLGLALAVGLTFSFPVGNGLWVVLGTLSVLRSSALTTSANVLRAVIGTVIGILIGALAIGLLGENTVVMWLLLPLVSFGSAYVPEIASFAAGQAAFTMLVLIVFTMITPTGWQLGLIRLEDVAIGAAVAVVVSILLWPRGAGPWMRPMIDNACIVGSRYLRAAVYRVTRGASQDADDAVITLSHEAVSAIRAVDDLIRHYLSESGGPTDSRTPAVRASNRIWRLRTTADLVADVLPPPIAAYPRARMVLETHADAICSRLQSADAPTILLPINDAFIPALRTDAGTDRFGISAAMPLVLVAANIGELELIYPPVSETTPAGHD